MKKRDDLYISQILERISLIKKHLKGVSREKFAKSALHKSAVIRELEVIGEAARLVSLETKASHALLPWQEMMGMRNRLIHEYFNVDESIVWEVASVQLPLLEKDFEKAFLDTSPPIHPWRNCPIGYYFVNAFPRLTPSGGITEVQYWNDIFNPQTPLTPDIIKALFFSESSFNLDVKDQRVSNRNFARGPLQITDETRKILADEEGELTDHYMTLTADDIRDPAIAISAATRWLFHKKNLASKYLGREADWTEAVAHYKGYLRKKSDFRKQKGMKNFFTTLENLSGKR